MICAVCATEGRPNIEAVTIINGTAVCLEYAHFALVRKYVNNAGGPPAFAMIGDKRMLSIGSGDDPQ